MHGSLSFLHLSSPLCSTSHLAMSVIKSLWRSKMSSWQFWKSSKGKRNENGLNIKPVDISQHSLCDLLPHLQSDHICFQWLARGLWPQQYYQPKSWIASFKQVFKEQKYTLWITAAELESFLSWGDGTMQKETVAANHLILHHFAIVTLPVRQKISPSGWDKLLVFSNSHWVLSLLTLHDVNYAQLVLARLRLL